MKVYVETNPETIYSGRVKDEVKTTEIRMWFETDEEIEVLSLSDYTKQVRKGVVEEIREEFKKHLFDWYEDEQNANTDLYIDADWVWEILDQIQGENK